MQKTAPRYVDTTEVAKHLRRKLKVSFPGTKFSVRGHKYSGGSSIDIHWTDGPTAKAVEAISNGYAGSSFDGMIDLKVSGENWLLPDGTITHAGSKGTVGSRGTIPESVSDAPSPDAELVRLLCDFVFTHREISNYDQRKADVIAWLRENVNADWDRRYGPNSIEDEARRMVYNMEPGEDLWDVWQRV